MGKMIKGLYIAENDLARIAEVPDELNTWYTMLDCECIDIVKRKIGDRHYTIICDDEGLLKDRPYTMVAERDGEWYKEIVGSVFICNDDGEGNLKSITDDDAENIFRYLGGVMTGDGLRHVVEINCDEYEI